MTLNTFIECYEHKLVSSDLYTLEEARNAYRGNGVYVFYLKNTPIYVGSAKNIRTRLTHHKNRNGSALYEKMEDYWKDSKAEEIIENCLLKCVQVPIGRSELEEHLIKKFKPVFNNYKINKRRGTLKKLTTDNK